MRSRRVYLLLVLAILVVYLALREAIGSEPRTTFVDAVYASQDLEPYSIISASQVMTGTKIASSMAGAFYGAPEQVVGLMTTRSIHKGERIDRAAAMLPGQFRLVDNMKYEVASFPAVFSEMVGGQVRAGHKINIYGYRRGQGLKDPGEMLLVASNVLVVDVRTASGESPQPTAEASSTGQDDIAQLTNFGLAAQPASVVTVAAEPWVIQEIIAKLGGMNLSAWVTLAPDPSVFTTPLPPMPTATPTPTPGPMLTPAATNPAQTPTVLEGRIHMSDREAGPTYTTFPNSTSVVWAVVELTYSAPQGPVPIRLDVRLDGNTVFASDYTHPQSGQASYMLNPTGGFQPDSDFATTAYAGGKAFSVQWETCGNTQLPATGAESSASVGN